MELLFKLMVALILHNKYIKTGNGAPPESDEYTKLQSQYGNGKASNRDYYQNLKNKYKMGYNRYKSIPLSVTHFTKTIGNNPLQQSHFNEKIPLGNRKNINTHGTKVDGTGDCDCEGLSQLLTIASNINKENNCENKILQNARRQFIKAAAAVAAVAATMQSNCMQMDKATPSSHLVPPGTQTAYYKSNENKVDISSEAYGVPDLIKSSVNNVNSWSLVNEKQIKQDRYARDNQYDVVFEASLNVYEASISNSEAISQMEPINQKAQTEPNYQVVYFQPEGYPKITKGNSNLNEHNRLDVIQKESNVTKNDTSTHTEANYKDVNLRPERYENITKGSSNLNEHNRLDVIPKQSNINIDPSTQMERNCQQVVQLRPVGFVGDQKTP